MRCLVMVAASLSEQAVTTEPITAPSASISASENDDLRIATLATGSSPLSIRDSSTHWRPICCCQCCGMAAETLATEPGSRPAISEEELLGCSS